MWNQPSGGAPVTSYIVHYNDGDGGDSIRPLASMLTSYDITGLTIDTTYTISVEATSQHLSGESEDMPFTLRAF